jgi:hypothetical protein
LGGKLSEISNLAGGIDVVTLVPKKMSRPRLEDGSEREGGFDQLCSDGFADLAERFREESILADHLLIRMRRNVSLSPSGEDRSARRIVRAAEQLLQLRVVVD